MVVRHRPRPRHRPSSLVPYADRMEALPGLATACPQALSPVDVTGNLIEAKGRDYPFPAHTTLDHSRGAVAPLRVIRGGAAGPTIEGSPFCEWHECCAERARHKRDI